MVDVTQTADVPDTATAAIAASADIADIAIVGAGAAGLATAIFARTPDRDGFAGGRAPKVVLLDGARKPGAKILVSGGGRCNVTNVSVGERDFSTAGSTAVIRRVLRAFPVAETVAWFRELGISLHEEEHGKLFPDTNRARDVLDALLLEVRRRGATLIPAARVESIRRDGPRFELAIGASRLRARAVVLATGGQALPKSGSDGAGFAIASALGHTIVPTTPALAPLTLEDPDPGGPLHVRLSGVAHIVELSIWIDGTASRRVTGSMLWTHFGVSGPAALDASRHIERARVLGQQVRVTVNVLPGRRFDEVNQHLLSSGARQTQASVLTCLSRDIPASVAQAWLDRLRISPRQPLSQLPRAERQQLTRALTELELPVSGTRGYTFAEATAGGVALGEIDPGTMASRCCPGLYLVGEILDVDGRLGGFNFQWAWSSARVAGRALSRLAQTSGS